MTYAKAAKVAIRADFKDRLRYLFGSVLPELPIELHPTPKPKTNLQKAGTEQVKSCHKCLISIGVTHALE